jgi:hypothetical protein
MRKEAVWRNLGYTYCPGAGLEGRREIIKIRIVGLWVEI